MREWGLVGGLVGEGCLEEEEGGGGCWMLVWMDGGGLERYRWREWRGWMDGECADILGLYYVKSIDLFDFFGVEALTSEMVSVF